MSLGIATVIVALMVAPGIVALVAAISALRISRDLGNTAMTLTLGAAMALFVHLAAALVIWPVWAVAAAPLSGGEPGALGRVLDSIALALRGAEIAPRDLLNLMIYAAYAVIVGAVLGYRFGRAVVDHRIPLAVFHGAYYRFTKRDDNLVIYASVLTRSEIGGARLLYVGVLEELVPGGGNEIGQVTLIAPYKCLMTREGDKPADMRLVTTPTQDIEEETGDEENVLAISGSEIANLVLYTQRLAVPA